MEVGSSPWNKVFRNAELREMILEYAMMNGEDVNRGTVCSVRLVNTEWAVATSKIFKKMKKPLFRLVLNNDNSLWKESEFVRRNGKLLDKFVDAVTRPNSRSLGIFPPFSLKIEAEVFREERYGTLSRCFRMCGRGLMEMELTLPVGSIEFTGVQWIPILPVLTKVTLNFPNQKVCHTTSHLIHNILDKAKAMENLEVTYSPELPSDFQYIHPLPSSLSSINLGSVLSTRQLMTIRNNQLPNLSHLELVVPQKSLHTGLLFEALENVRTTLKSFSIAGMEYTGTRGEVTYLRFPLMEKLEKLEITSMNCQLETDASQLELMLPKLMKLALTNQTLSMFRKWIGSFKSSIVTTVDVHVVKMTRVVSRPVLTTYTLEGHDISALHRSFPNLTSLSISIYPDPELTSGLLYIFQEMKKLTDLTLEVDPGSEQLADFWDGLLVGEEQSLVEMLSSCPDLWEEFPITHAGTPSIRNLKNLRSLSLWEMDMESTASRKEKPLITDVSFYFSFFRMPNLKTLKFGGPFEPRQATMKTWRNIGRIITYE